MSVFIEWLGQKSQFVKRHKRGFEFVLEMSWWVLLWVLIISHTQLLLTECPLLYDHELRQEWCGRILANSSGFNLTEVAFSMGQ